MPESYVRFWIENGIEVAMCTAQDFRDAMNERDRLRAQIDAMQAVCEAARVLRQNVGASNAHMATCQDSPCSTCEALDELELDAGMELDMQLAQLDTATNAERSR